MFKLKFILPMFAFVLAIGMSFAFTSATEDGYYTSGYIQLDGQWYEVNVDCDSASQFDCEVQIQGELPTYPLHTQKNVNSPILKGGDLLPKVIMDPR